MMRPRTAGAFTVTCSVASQVSHSQGGDTLVRCPQVSGSSVIFWMVATLNSGVCYPEDVGNLSFR